MEASSDFPSAKPSDNIYDHKRIGLSSRLAALNAMRGLSEALRA